MKFNFLLICILLPSCSGIPSGSYYRIKWQDNPPKIASKFQVPLCSLRESNKGKQFKAGDVVFIPHGGGLFAQVPDCGPTENLLSKGDYIWPIKGHRRISSKYGIRWNRHHNGIDIPARKGTSIRAARAGRVAYSGFSLDGYGNLTILRHVDGSKTYYAHASKNYFKKGKWVKKGQVIGKVGSTGNSTGPHLHFEIRKYGFALNPLHFYSANF